MHSRERESKVRWRQKEKVREKRNSYESDQLINEFAMVKNIPLTISIHRPSPILINILFLCWEML